MYKCTYIFHKNREILNKYCKNRLVLDFRENQWRFSADPIETKHHCCIYHSIGSLDRLPEEFSWYLPPLLILDIKEILKLKSWIVISHGDSIHFFVFLVFLKPVKLALKSNFVGNFSAHHIPNIIEFSIYLFCD